MRQLFVVDSLDKHLQDENELIRLRRLLPAARATRARSAQFYVVLICHDSTGVGGLFCICVESINLNLNLKSLLIGSATTTADSSEGDNREEPVVREEEIDETEVSEEVVVRVARLPKEPKSPVLPPPPGHELVFSF